MKPISTLKQDDYLKLYIAEQEGLITVNFELSHLNQSLSASLSENSSNSSTTQTLNIIDKLMSFYQKDEFSSIVEQWNLLRAQVIEEMCEQILFPELEKELRSKLLQEAKYYVFVESARKLRSILRIAPFVPDLKTFDGIDDDSNDGLTVLAITYSTCGEGIVDTSVFSQSSVCVCVCVDCDGELVDFIRLDKLTVKLNKEQLSINQNDVVALENLHKDKREKILDLGRLETFILKKMPKVIVIATEDKNAFTIFEDVKFSLRRLIENNKNIIKLQGKKYSYLIVRATRNVSICWSLVTCQSPGTIKKFNIFKKT